MFTSVKEHGTQLYSFNGVHAYLNDDKDKCNLMRLQQRTFTSTDNFNFFTHKKERSI